jgi:abortive infection bacteriophage resistance protein
MAIYDKPHLTHGEQVLHLKAKGMIFGDESQAMKHLARIGYYRLSAYWHPYKVKQADTDKPASERFREATRFENVLTLYDYDSRIRRLVLEGVEIAEVSLRSQVAHLLGARNAFAYMRPEQLYGNFSKVDREGKTPHQRWLEGYNEKMHRPGEVFTAHLIAKYGLPLPIWASVELWELN